MTLYDLLPLLRQQEPYNRLLDAVRRGSHRWVVGPAGAEKAYLLAALAEDLAVPGPVAGSEQGRGAVLLVTPSHDAAERLHDDLLTFAPSLAGAISVFPQWDALRTDGERPAPQTVGERTAVLLRLVDGPPPWIIAPVSALLRLVPSPDDLRASMRRIRQGEHSDREAMVSFLAAIGYERMELVEARGQFAVRGGILDVFPAHLDVPVRAEWFGDEIESLREFDPTTQRSTRSIPAALLTSVREAGGNATVLDYLPPSSVLMLDEPDELQRQARTLWEHAAPATLVPWEDLLRRAHATVRLSLSALHGAENAKAEIPMRFTGVEAFGGQMKLLARALEEWQAKGQRIVIATTQAQRMREILTDHGVSALATGESATLPEPGTVAVINAPLSRGFQLDAAALVVVSDSEIVGWRRRRRKLRFREGIRLYSWTDLTTGDLVVHIHHGIGIYRGMVRLLLHSAERDYLHLEYAQGDRLYVPTDQINLVQRYIGVEGQQPKIHRLGGAEWEREKKRVKEAAQEMARELLQLYAVRETVPGHAFSADTPWQQELEATFEFEETPDQWLAIQDVKRDMEAPKPMDRLIAGDVGYGKTEVALRAAFKAVMDGKQVAVLVPTTILAQQHYNVFLKRLAAYPVKVEVLSRFRSRLDQRRVIDGVAAGTVDIAIGTHRLLQKDVRFAKLGLVIIDEEQRFGVKHEERLEQVMMDFLGGRSDVLVCTTIVEIGLDIPRVNTILVEDAHLMGLSQLYQLRGRVGRSDRQAYCYLLYPRGAPLTDEARQRLQAMQEFVELGSGFKLAMRDLEIRGAGNLLGPEQHGHLAAVGFELYSRLLDESIRELRGQIVEEAPDATVDLGVDAYLPESYIPDEGQRMAMYRKMAAVRTPEEADEAAEEIADRYGPPPSQAVNLQRIVRLRALARDAGVAAISREQDRIALKRAAGWSLTADEEAALLRQFGGRLTAGAGILRLRPSGPGLADADTITEVLQALAHHARRQAPAGRAPSPADK